MKNQKLTGRKSAFRTVALAACSVLALQASNALAQTSTTGNTIKPLYGNISPFYGNLSAFYGNLSPFYGNLSAFYGNLSPFWGNLSAFWSSTNPFVVDTTSQTIAKYGTGYDPFWGSEDANPYTHNPSEFIDYSHIAGFWRQESASWTKVQSAWAAAKVSGDYTTVAGLLNTTILAPVSTFWGEALGKDQVAKKAAPQPVLKALTQSGIALKADGTVQTSSLADVSPTAQAMFFLNLYDGLMSYSGTGHVDWRMGATHWSPALAGIATSGDQSKPITIGMLDFTVSNSTKHAKGTLLQYGSDVFGDGHGAAVGSLIIGSFDGTGIMGVLPKGSGRVIVYDPYDSTNTTNWNDVGTGIQFLANSTFAKQGAPTGVLNASLGEPGWTLSPGWNTALSSGAAKGHNLVIAAGNDGMTQRSNVPWNFATNPNLIIVGSVGVDGAISNFSNRPGEACLLDTSANSQTCAEANKLKYRFIVAPGELVLITDGAGNISRQTGTSLAAPQVSAAIGLLQARWPWLANYPDETAQIILKSATPLGVNPGADAVYGVGELNIQASQSPLNWASLQYFSVVAGKVGATPISLASVVTNVSTSSPSSWNASKLSITALEKVGATVRDFQIPLASTLVGQAAPRSSGSGNYQAYLTSDLKSWVSGGGKFTGNNLNTSQFADLTTSSASVGRVMGMDLRVALSPREVPLGFKASDLDTNLDFALVGSRSSLRFGLGNGAAALGGSDGSGQKSDIAARRGGANPVLSLASGGVFFDWRVTPVDRVTFSFGATERQDARDLSFYGISNNPKQVYQADAEHLGLDYAVNDRFTVRTALMRLREQSGLLGFQSVDPNQLGGGATTTALNLGFDWALGDGFLLTATGTLAQTATARDQTLTTTAGGLDSSAAELALSKAGVFVQEDRLRVSVSKSLQVYHGQINFGSYGVVDRQTGELGVINQTVDASHGPIPWAVEMMYGRILPRQSAEVSAFVRTETNVDDPGSSRPYNYTVGGKYRLAF